MPENSRPLAAVHYYYLLKSDDEDLRRLWRMLTGEENLEGDGLPASGIPELGLDEPAETGIRCRIVHHIDGEQSSFCLCLLSDISVIEVDYRRQDGTLDEEWRRVSDAIESDRDRLLSGLNGVFGETTLLIAPAGTSFEAIVSAADDTGGTALQSRLASRAKNMDTTALLVHFPDMSAAGRDYYAMVADDPVPFSSTVLPEFDSLIKKLKRTSSYFDIQRQTIVSERADVDRQVGELLHRQVVNESGVEPDTQILENQITSLSRLFGLLATDSLLVRKSSDRLSRDIKLLDQELALLVATPDSTEEIGSHYLGRFNLDLNEADIEIRNLDFSRQNAQAAIEVVRTQVEIMRAGEEAAIQRQSKELLSSSLVLQEERLALQVAAGFIEFVLIFYYVMKSWEGIAGIEPVEHISPVVRLLVIGSFSASAAVGTHFLALAIQRRSVKSVGLWVSAAVLVLAFIAMEMLTVANS
ncbi:MAG: hypothetical protein HZB44_01970 [Actinobacteria bacterium]|nr:hypothetical protein [Actinomycetota bacterium]